MNVEGKQITTESTSADAAATKYKCGGGYFVTDTHLQNLPSIAYNPCSPDNYKQTSPATVFCLKDGFPFLVFHLSYYCRRFQPRLQMR